MVDEQGEASWLSYTNLSDSYDRRARFAPAVITILFLMPLSAALALPLGGWLTLLISGFGIGAVGAFGISHLASACGNRAQERLWPRWPHDAPTHCWLRPDDNSRSMQQKALWYTAIKRQTGLRLSAEPGRDQQLEATINDAVSQLRHRLRNSPHADRLNKHNADYGFARNLLGLCPVWLGFGVVSCLGTWEAYLRHNGILFWPLLSSVILLFGVLLAVVLLPRYVRIRAIHYAESFFSAVLELDRAQETSQSGD